MLYSSRPTLLTIYQAISKLAKCLYIQLIAPMHCYADTCLYIWISLMIASWLLVSCETVSSILAFDLEPTVIEFIYYLLTSAGRSSVFFSIPINYLFEMPFRAIIELDWHAEWKTKQLHFCYIMQLSMDNLTLVYNSFR